MPIHRLEVSKTVNMMQLSTRIAVFLIFVAVGVDAHGFMSSPRARNYVAYKEGLYYGGNASTPSKEYCPHCLNKGGTLGQCGVVENRNYDYPKNALGGALVPNVQATYTRGSQIDIEVVLTTIHKGHFVVNACPIAVGGVATGECFQNHPLEFMQDLLYGAPKDPNYPYRAYVAPAGYSKLMAVNVGISGTLYRYRFKLPKNVVGSHVLIQWHYLTGNTCVYPGYSQYHWPSDWPPSNTGTGICATIPPDGNGFPEQFWNCADVNIVDVGGPVAQTAPRKSPNPQPVRAPTRPSPVRATTTGGSSVGTCGTGNVGNGVCANSKLCCSKWGWCGSSSSYCTHRTLTEGTCGNGKVGNGICKTPGYCCSKFGFCGSDPVYCDNKATKGTCGNGNRGNGICANPSYCCSKFGYCGSDTSYCTNSTTAVGNCGGGRVGNGRCENPKLCCSKAGYCGTGSDYCGSKGTCGGGEIGNGICVDSRLCCSKAGYCGNSTAYCSNKAPVPTATKPVTRPATRPFQRPLSRPVAKLPSRRPTHRPTPPVKRRETLGICGNGNVGNGVCADQSLCCSRFGYCGSTSQYCNGAGTCGNGVIGNGVCRNPTFCCSKFGYCGFGKAYCSRNTTSSIGTCGDGQVGNGLCTNPNLCCSKAGYCGTGKLYCTANSTSTTGTCGDGNKGNGICANANLCCSNAGYCGATYAYCNNNPSGGTCGGGHVGNGRCQNPSNCCSKAGFCGNTTAYCGNKAPVAPPPNHRPASLPTRQHVTRPTSRPTNLAPVTRPVARPVTVRPTLRLTAPPPVPHPTPRLTVTRPTFRPSIPPPPVRPTRRPTRAIVRSRRVASSVVGTCGGGTTGNGVCADASLCCSKWGWCGSTSDYCDSTASPVQHSAVVPFVNTETNLQVTSYPTPPPAPSLPIVCNSSSDVMNVNFGYYQSWAIWRQQGCNKVLPNAINVAGNHYTHVAYAFAGINASDYLAPWADDYQGEPTQYASFNSLKATYPNLKTSIAVGGWTFNDPGATATRFSDIAASSSRRATFASSVISFLDTYGFDGIDFDWEYPGDTTRGGQAADVQNYPLLLKAVRDAAAAAGKQIVISMAITVSPTRLSTGYNLPALAPYVDFFNLMAYDIHGDWDIPQIIGAHTDLSYIKNSVQYFLHNGVPSNKIVLGLAAYGHTYYLSDPTCTAPGCGFTSGGPGGCAGATGDMPYFTIDQYVQSKNYDSLTFNPTTSSMEMVISGNVWISFDDPVTLGIKAAYAASMCMRGTMWWAVDLLTSPILLGSSASPIASPTTGVASQPASPVSIAPPPVAIPQAPLTVKPRRTARPRRTRTKAPVKPTPVASPNPTSVPVQHPSTPSPSKASPTSTSTTDFIVSTASRCGTSELDARGNCGAVCAQETDCGTGKWCWSVFPNYCGSMPVQKCTDLSQASSGPRCGVDEIHARELCGNKCASDVDCGTGQRCFPVQLNLCDCQGR